MKIKEFIEDFKIPEKYITVISENQISLSFEVLGALANLAVRENLNPKFKKKGKKSHSSLVWVG